MYDLSGNEPKPELEQSNFMYSIAKPELCNLNPSSVHYLVSKKLHLFHNYVIIATSYSKK